MTVRPEEGRNMYGRKRGETKKEPGKIPAFLAGTPIHGTAAFLT
jgi:hypothetical protein